MEWNRASGERNNLQGKQGKQTGHSAIIAFPDCFVSTDQAAWIY
jgi:hypothetical protein